MNSNQREECLHLITQQMYRTANWRRALASKYKDDSRNMRAAQRLNDLETRATSIPDQIWEVLQHHYHWSDERFIEAVALTNRGVVFRIPASDLDSYWSSLLDNVATMYEAA